MPKVVRVEKPKEASRIVELKKQVRQLQQALGQTQLKNVVHEAMLELACEQLGVDVASFKKKADAKGWSVRDGKAGSR
jgi:hypothetical protein